jgi:hypothetical protein
MDIRIGRETLDVKATIRRGLTRRRGRGLHGLVIGDADEIHISIDRERGVILFAESWFKGVPYRILEAERIAFDEQFGPETLRLHHCLGSIGWTLGTMGSALAVLSNSAQNAESVAAICV